MAKSSGYHLIQDSVEWMGEYLKRAWAAAGVPTIKAKGKKAEVLTHEEFLERFRYCEMCEQVYSITQAGALVDGNDEGYYNLCAKCYED